MDNITVQNNYKASIINCYKQYKITKNGVWKLQAKIEYKGYINACGLLTLKQIINESRVI